VKIKSPERSPSLGLRRFDINAIGRFAVPPFAYDADGFVLVRRVI
jgi:hypothetical protein